MDRVRVDQASAIKKQPADRQIIKRRRWLLLRNSDNLSAEQSVKLDELLAASAPLALVYLLKTALKEIWFAPNLIERFFNRQFCRLATRCDKPAHRFNAFFQLVSAYIWLLGARPKEGT